MSVNIIESHFTLPLNKEGLKKGPKGDYTIVVKIGGGNKSAIIKFKDPKHRDQMSNRLNEIAETNEVELTLEIAA